MRSDDLHEAAGGRYRGRKFFAIFSGMDRPILTKLGMLAPLNKRNVSVMATVTVTVTVMMTVTVKVKVTVTVTVTGMGTGMGTGSLF